jgi:hypothetical protein
MSERQLLADCLAALVGDTRLRIWRANTGAAEVHGRFVRFGVKGQADLSGLLRSGRRVEIETKAPDGRLSPAQRAFGAMVTEYGGLYLVVRSVAELLTALDNAAGRRE